MEDRLQKKLQKLEYSMKNYSKKFVGKEVTYYTRENAPYWLVKLLLDLYKELSPNTATSGSVWLNKGKVRYSLDSTVFKNTRYRIILAIDND